MAHLLIRASGATFAVYGDEFRAVLGPSFQRPVLTETNAHEGPVYVAAEHALYFTTVPEPGPKNVAIKRLQLARRRRFHSRRKRSIRWSFPRTWPTA